MNFEKIITDRATFPDDAAFIVAANAVEYRLKSYFASVRTVYNLCGRSAAERISAALGQADPIAAAMFSIPGDENGTGGGIDIGLAEAQGMLDYLTTVILPDEQPVITTAQAQTIKQLGQEVTANCSTRYGVETMTPEIIAQAQATTADEAVFSALQAQHQLEMDTWNAANARHGRRLDYFNTHRGEGITLEQLNAVE